MDIPPSQVGQGAAAAVLKLAKRRAPGAGGNRRVAAAERLQLGLLVSAHHELARVKQLALETPRVQIEHSPPSGGSRGRGERSTSAPAKV
jgi:hypothetical protein